MKQSTRWIVVLLGGFMLGAAVSPFVSAQSAPPITGTLTGIVFDSTTGGPLIHATVHVLGTEYSGESDLFGEFLISGLPIGEYGITFSHRRADQLEFSPPAFIVRIREGETTRSELFVPSLPAIMTAGCGPLDVGTGALTGFVRERFRRTPLPFSTVGLSWAASGDVPAGEVTGVTDVDGVYRICNVPADVTITAEAQFIGLTVRTSGLVIAPNESRQRDFDIDAIAVDKKKVDLDRQARERLTGGETDVQGRLTDAESSEPVVGALIRIRNHEEVVFTNESGRFVFHDVRAGVRVLDVEHLVYGDQTTEVLLTRGGATDVEVQVRDQAIELDPIVVTARKQPRLDRRTIALGTRKDVLLREEIVQLASLARSAGDLLRRFPGIRVSIRDVGGERLLCVNRGRGGLDRDSRLSGRESFGREPGCDTLPVFVDGMQMMTPEVFLLTLSPLNFESLEIVTGTEAAGYPGAQNGAIVIYTKGNGPWARRDR